jgi:hypothetical protein
MALAARQPEAAVAIQIQNADIRGSPYSLLHFACTRLYRLTKGDLRQLFLREP